MPVLLLNCIYPNLLVTFKELFPLLLYRDNKDISMLSLHQSNLEAVSRGILHLYELYSDRDKVNHFRTVTQPQREGRQAHRDAVVKYKWEKRTV